MSKIYSSHIFHIFLIGVFSFLLISIPNSFGEEENILITISPEMDQVIFDGIWTHPLEWKRSSLDTIRYNDSSVIHLRTAHQDDFVYILIDAVFDTNVNFGTDRAIVCFDTENDKSSIADENDYCFFVTLDQKHSFMYQGGSPIVLQHNLKKIPSHDNFIALGGKSNEHDRHSKIPHSTYEMKIPTDVIGRSDNYGFYFSVYDHESKKTYHWPMLDYHENKIPSPSEWGNLISPDKSLPEFELPLIIMIISLTFFFVFSKNGAFPKWSFDR